MKKIKTLVQVHLQPLRCPAHLDQQSVTLVCLFQTRTILVSLIRPAGSDYRLVTNWFHFWDLIDVTLADEDFESMFSDVLTDADDVVDGADNLYTWYMVAIPRILES